MNATYLTLEELSSRVNYRPETIMKTKVGRDLIEGIHFVRPFGGRKLLFIWEKIEQDMLAGVNRVQSIPMANGGYCHG